MVTKRWPRLTTADLMAAVAVIAVILAVVSLIHRSRSIVESLESPIAVRGWSETDLDLADGHALPLPGFWRLPASSPALARATERGIEVGADGRVYGLVPVHHWCGNDPVREHIARVDLALYLEYLGEGEPAVAPAPGLNVAPNRPGGTFSPLGWEYGEYLEFRSWCHLVQEARGTAGTSRPAPQRTLATAASSGNETVTLGGPGR